MDHLHLWGRGWSSCHTPPQALFPHRNRAGHTCRCSAVSPERLWVFTVTHEPYLWPPHQWRHTDGVTQAKRVFPLFPFRGFSGTPPACWLSVFKKEKREKTHSWANSATFSPPCSFPKAFGSRVHLAELQAFWCQHGHLDNYTLLHFACEERRCPYQPPLPMPLLVSLVSAGWYLRSLA